MKKSLLSVILLGVLSLGLTSCVETPLIYGEEGTTWIVEGGDRPTGHIGEEHTEHLYDEGIVTTQPTCTEEGVMTYTCTICGDTYTEKIEPLGHDLVSTETEPTCGEDGYITYVCSRCDYTATEPSGKSATEQHTYDEGEVTKEASCTEDGVLTYTCLVCGDTYTETIQALGHDYVSTETAPTCGEDGYITKVCSRCGDTQTEPSGQSATGEHTYVLVPDETDASSGHHSVCSVCGYEESSEVIAHTFTYTINGDGTHTKVCECGYGVTESHSLPSEYTDNGDGTHSRSCECGYIESEAHSYTGSFGSSSCSKCGSIESDLGLNFTLSGNELSISGVTEDFTGGDLVIPSSYCGYPVTNIAKNAFKSNTDITSVVIPNTVTRIEEGGFDGCSNLASVTFSETSGLTYLGYRSFRGCSSITSFEVPETVNDTGTYVFQECTSLKTCTFPKEFGTLKNGTFNNCSSLEEFTLPENATSIHSSTFQGCSSLKEITIPSGVTTINEQAFYGCSSLSAVNSLDNSKVEAIGKQAFQGCSSLTEIKFPSTLSDLSGERVFYGCTSLETISIPTGCQITSLGNYFAYNCEKLTSFTIPTTVTSIGTYAFYSCSSLTGEFVIPDGVTSIGQNTFQYCTGITSVVMGSGVTSIGNNAFNNCTSLESVVLSEDVTLSNTAFWYCSAITTVYYYGDETSWSNLNKGNSNDNLLTATVYYYSDTYVNEYSWHLDSNGSPTTVY